MYFLKLFVSNLYAASCAPTSLAFAKEEYEEAMAN
jgi:hypothetical protein